MDRRERIVSFEDCEFMKKHSQHMTNPFNFRNLPDDGSSGK